MDNNYLMKIRKRINNFILNRMDLLLDYKICGQSLSKYEKSIFRDDEKGVGMTGSQATRYLILKYIFDRVDIKDSDSFIDVGCGKGRVLAYMVNHGYKCSISGIEINEISGKIAAEWTGKYPKIVFMIGDAFKLNYNDYTVLFFGRPFLPVTFWSLLNRLNLN